MSSFEGKFGDYVIRLSTRKNKKYMAHIGDGKWIHFGDKRYQQYFDRMGQYSELDHEDPVRRKSFHSRFQRFINEEPSAAWFSLNILW